MTEAVKTIRGSALGRVIRTILPKPVYRGIAARVRQRAVKWGDLRRSQPLSREFAEDRGLPVDRYYIERFLREHASDIQGTVMEVADATYTRALGGDRVTRSEVLHATEGNPAATIVGDLGSGQGIPAGQMDCIIITQTLQFVYDLPGARTLRRALCPGGVVLGSVPGISQISRYDMDRWGEYWRFTSMSVRRLFEAEFGPGNVQVQAFGSVLTATAFLHGLSADELTASELALRDEDYEVLIMVRAQVESPAA